MDVPLPRGAELRVPFLSFHAYFPTLHRTDADGGFGRAREVFAMKRLERLLKLRSQREDRAAREVADKQQNLERAEERMRELVERRTQPVVDARRIEAFRMTGAWTVDELEAAHQQLLSGSTDLEKARAALQTARSERKVLQEHVDRARAAAALIASRVAQSAADEMAVTRRMYLDRQEEQD